MTFEPPDPNHPEAVACTPIPLVPAGFNKNAVLPYGLTTDNIAAAMSDFLEFLRVVNHRLYAAQIQRLECFMMPANFSTLVSEFMSSRIPGHCPKLAKNNYHNGHPDVIPWGMFPGNSVQHASEGIEIKASRYEKGWQGHNPEDTWLMVFVYDSNRPRDTMSHNQRPFQFLAVLGERLVKADWLFTGRSETSRRTITASVTTSGYNKMIANWIYRAPRLKTPEILAQ